MVPCNGPDSLRQRVFFEFFLRTEDEEIPINKNMVRHRARTVLPVDFPFGVADHWIGESMLD